MSALSDVLERYWGYTSFRPLQAEAMQAILDDRDSLVVMPTGAGKSLCYQLPGLALGGTTLVISPLLALIDEVLDYARLESGKVAIEHAVFDAARCFESTLDLVADQARAVVLEQRPVVGVLVDRAVVGRGGDGLGHLDDRRGLQLASA